jgi:hypothetical protein
MIGFLGFDGAFGTSRIVFDLGGVFGASSISFLAFKGAFGTSATIFDLGGVFGTFSSILAFGAAFCGILA